VSFGLDGGARLPAHPCEPFHERFTCFKLCPLQQFVPLSSRCRRTVSNTVFLKSSNGSFKRRRRVLGFHLQAKQQVHDPKRTNPLQSSVPVEAQHSCTLRRLARPSPRMPGWALGSPSIPLPYSFFSTVALRAAACVSQREGPRLQPLGSPSFFLSCRSLRYPLRVLAFVLLALPLRPRQSPTRSLMRRRSLTGLTTLWHTPRRLLVSIKTNKGASKAITSTCMCALSGTPRGLQHSLPLRQGLPERRASHTRERTGCPNEKQGYLPGRHLSCYVPDFKSCSSNI
jgi:hypothetical protein